MFPRSVCSWFSPRCRRSDCRSVCLSFCRLQLEDLAKVSIKGQVVQAAKMPTSNAYRRADSPSTRHR